FLSNHFGKKMAAMRVHRRLVEYRGAKGVNFPAPLGFLLDQQVEKIKNARFCEQVTPTSRLPHSNAAPQLRQSALIVQKQQTLERGVGVESRFAHE
ncbi:MAG TPA: hypothetical protein VIE65_01580, partial [Methylobacter sp.]